MTEHDAVGTAPPFTHPNQWYLDQLASDVDLITHALAGYGPTGLDQPVAACPGWDVRKLVVHLGVVHRWATFAIVNGEPPASMQEFEPDHDAASDATELAAWFQVGATELMAALAGIDPSAPAWHPWPGAKVAGFWPRRQMQETSIHRWDVQAALGAADPIPTDVAADGIDEWFALAVPRRHARDGVPFPAGSFHVHCTDVDGDSTAGGEWLGWTDDAGEYHMVREHRKGDAALRGPADAINLTLWGRLPANADELSPVGDETVMRDWTTFGG